MTNDETQKKGKISMNNEHTQEALKEAQEKLQRGMVDNMNELIRKAQEKLQAEEKGLLTTGRQYKTDGRLEIYIGDTLALTFSKAKVETEEVDGQIRFKAEREYINHLAEETNE